MGKVTDGYAERLIEDSTAIMDADQMLLTAASDVAGGGPIQGADRIAATTIRYLS